MGGRGGDRPPRARDRVRRPRRQRRRRLTRPTGRGAALLATLLLLDPAPAGAQTNESRDDVVAPQLEDLAYLSGNALVGGLTAGVGQALRGGEFWPAFRDGAVGGLIAYAGRRVAASGFDGAGFAGRQIGALGASIVRNASADRPLLGHVALPLGPVRVHLERDSSARSPPMRVELDLPTLLVTAWLVASDDAAFQLDESLSAGAPVFYTHDRGADGNWSGDQMAGAVRIRGNPADPLPDFTRAQALGHELTHVVQYDFSSLVWGEPIEEWLVGRYGGGWLARHVDAGLHLPLWGAANLVVPYDARPWEREAGFVSGAARGDAD